MGEGGNLWGEVLFLSEKKMEKKLLIWILSKWVLYWSINNELDGRSLKVEYAKSPDDPPNYLEKKPSAPTPAPNSSTVFIANLSLEMTEERMWEIFADCGEISEIRMLYRNGVFQRCAFVDYTDMESAGEALNFHNTLLDGRTIRISPAENRY